MRMRLYTALLAATFTLSACGRVDTPMGVSAMAERQHTASVVVAGDASAHAKRFADAIRAAQFTGDLTLKGAVVTLAADDQPAVAYDFSTAPQDGLVTVRMDGFSTRVEESKLVTAASEKVIPAIVVTVAVQMALGGAKALLAYYLAHPKDFNQHDAIRATLIGMGDALITFIPHGTEFEALVPIAVDLIMKIKVADLKHIADAAMTEVDKIVEVIKHYFQKPNTTTVLFN